MSPARAGTRRTPTVDFDDVLASAVAGFTTTELVRRPAGPGEPAEDPQLDPLMVKSYQEDAAGALGEIPVAYAFRVNDRIKAAHRRIRWLNKDADLRLKIQWLSVDGDDTTPEHSRVIPETQWEAWAAEHADDEVEIRFLVHPPREMGQRVNQSRRGKKARA